MKFSVASEHRHYFQKQLAIEFEGLLNEDQLNELKTACDATLALRLGTKPRQLKELPADQLFLAGHDLWRTHAFIKKIVTMRMLAEIASELIECKPLRLGYDQFFVAPPKIQHLQSTDPLTTLLKQQPTIKEVSCLNGILCGVMLCLTNPEINTAVNDPATTSSHTLLIPPVNLFSKVAGHAIFFHPNARIDFPQLLNHSDQTYLMIIYTQAITQYFLNENDPHTHALKRLGYVIGDRLSDRLNPIVYR